jgi:UPF0755 protein
MLVILGGISYGLYYYDAPGPLSERTNVVFKRGTGFVAIVDQMADSGVIRDPLLFKALAVLSGDARKFKAGEYDFSAAISPRLIMNMIAEGRVVVHKITIAEGLTAEQVLTLLNGDTTLEGAILGNIDEGSLLPQTYHFVYGDQRQDLIVRMQAGMKTTLNELWEKRKKDLPFQTPQQALTLASIVEKETGVTEERPRVAAVFINRLHKRMKLQTDPTVVYGIEKEHGPLGRPLFSSDLKYPSPYNTYLIDGLPPGPIANPGRAAIEAVLNPPDTNELYFVATGTGGHNFSATFEGHSANVKSYRKQKAKNAK